jgi:ribosomal protein L7/L12
MPVRCIQAICKRPESDLKAKGLHVSVETNLIAALLGFALGLVLGRLSAAGSSPKPKASPLPRSAKSPALAIQGEALNQIQDLIGSGKKIEALKLYREVSGLGLKEAKDEIDRLASQPFSAAPPDPNDPLADVKGLLRSGRKIEALKAYREATGLGLKEAKDEIDRMDRQVRGR